MTLADAYYPLAAAFQWALALLILTAGRPDWVRAGFAVILAVNGLECVSFLAAGHGIALLPDPVGVPVDSLIVITVPFMLSRFPVPLRGPLADRHVRAAWLGLLALAASWLPLSYSLGPSVREWSRLVLHEGPLLVATLVLLLHVVPRVKELPPGPLRNQSVLVGAGLGVGLAYTSSLLGPSGLRNLVRGEPSVPAAFDLLFAVAFFFVVAGVLSLVVGAARRRRRDLLLFAGVLTVGLVIPPLEKFYLYGPGGSQPLVEFVTQTFRPALIAVALLWYDLFRVPSGVRRPLVPATAGFFCVSLLVLLTVLLSGRGLQADTVNPLAPLGAVLLLAGAGYVWRRQLGDLLQGGPHRDGGSDVARLGRLERYRLELERVRADPVAPAPGELTSLRRELGVAPGDHDALDAILRGSPVVPTAALRGARPGSVVADRYEVTKELGVGGQGRALLATDRSNGHLVVLKELLRPWEAGAEARRASLLREARVGARLSHPNLARVHGVLSLPHNTYLVREFVPGVTLGAWVAREGPLPAEAACRVLGDVLQGLGALHAAGVLHLDLKPDNVVLDPEGRAVVIDYGAARGVPAAEEGLTITSDHAAAGTLAWMPPEVVLGRAPDARADVFAAGALLHYLVTGEPHVRVAGRSRYEVEDDIVHAAPPLLAAVPPALARGLHRALARDPAARFPHARAFAEALQGSGAQHEEAQPRTDHVSRA